MSRKYALIGDKLGHTLSPPIHKRLFELRGREFSYELLEIDPSELDGRKAQLRELAGYNVTIPHKPAIIAQLDRLDDSAQRYGAVNCVDNKGGVSVGYNTDCDGFLRSVKSSGGKLSGSTLLLGAGGVGRMMAIETALAGGRLTMAVLEDFKPQAEKVYPKCDACAVGDEVIARADFVFDAIYNPKETLLIQKAKALGKTAVGGMAMLVWQAVSAHEIWDGDSYADEDVQAIIDEMYERVERDFK